MSINTIRYFALVSLLFLMSTNSRSLSSDQPPKVVVVVEEIERVGQNEARLRVKVTNTSAARVFSPGISFDPAKPNPDTYLEQKRRIAGWQVVAPCYHVPPPHIINLRPAVPLILERTLKVPLGNAACKERDIKLEGLFRWRVDYFERRAEASRYLERYFEDNKHKPRPASAFSEPFEIPPFHDPSEARPDH